MAGKKILVVDDEKRVTETLEGFFKAKGYEMFTALSGDEAVQIVKKEPIEMVLLDMKMPGLNGMEVLKIIKEQYPKTKVIVVTAYNDYKDKAGQLGADGFITKPFGMQYLSNKILEILEGRPLAVKEHKKTTDKIKLLFVENTEMVFNIFLKSHFLLYSWDEDCIIELAVGEEEAIKKTAVFKPDIVLLNTTTLSSSRCGPLAAKILDLSNAPKEIIMHGVQIDDTKSKTDKLESVSGSFFDMAYFEKLGNEIKKLAAIYNLRPPKNIGRTELLSGTNAKIKVIEKVKLENVSLVIQGLLAKHLGVEKEKIQPSAKLVEDLGADSLDTVELIMALEEEFDIEIPDEDAENIRTVQEIVSYIKQKVKL